MSKIKRVIDDLMEDEYISIFGTSPLKDDDVIINDEYIDNDFFINYEKDIYSSYIDENDIDSDYYL